jgi:hypothetical protein
MTKSDIIDIDSIDPRIKAIFEEYLGEARLVDNFGLRDGFLSESLKLYKNPDPDIPYGLICANPEFPDLWDCARAAFKLGSALEELEYDVEYYWVKKSTSIQNYCEVFDKTLDEWIQLDITPWYEKINPGHVASGRYPMVNRESYELFEITKISVMTSVKKYPERFVEVYVGAEFYKKEQDRDKFATVQIHTQESNHILGDSTDILLIRADVNLARMDSIRHKIKYNPVEEPEKFLNYLIAEKAIFVHSIYVPSSFNHQITGHVANINDLNSTIFEGDPTHITQNLNELKENYCVLANLIMKISPDLETLHLM